MAKIDLRCVLLLAVLEVYSGKSQRGHVFQHLKALFGFRVVSSPGDGLAGLELLLGAQLALELLDALRGAHAVEAPALRVRVHEVPLRRGLLAGPHLSGTGLEKAQH